MWMGPEEFARSKLWLAAPERQQERKRFPKRILSPEERQRRLALILSRNPEHVALWSASRKTNDRTCATMVRIESFVHGRISLVAYHEPRGAAKRARNLGWLKRETRQGPNRFRLCPKVRRGFKIGGRTRFPALPKRYTPYGKNLTRDAGHILEMSKEGLCYFVTLTIPTSQEEGLKVLSAASGYMADRLTGWLRGKIIADEYVYVWERQKRGTPHMHIMFRAYPFDRDYDFYGKVRREWYRILCDVSDETGIDLLLSDNGGSWRGKPESVNVDCKLVKRDFATYLSKYLSKGGDSQSSAYRYYPGRWWGCSNSIRDKVQAERTRAVVRVPSLYERSGVLQSFQAFVQGIAQRALEFSSYEKWGSTILSVFLRGVSSKLVARDVIAALSDTFDGLVDWVFKPEVDNVLLESG